MLCYCYAHHCANCFFLVSPSNQTKLFLCWRIFSCLVLLSGCFALISISFVIPFFRFFRNGMFEEIMWESVCVCAVLATFHVGSDGLVFLYFLLRYKQQQRFFLSLLLFLFLSTSFWFWFYFVVVDWFAVVAINNKMNNNNNVDNVSSLALTLCLSNKHTHTLSHTYSNTKQTLCA